MSSIALAMICKGEDGEHKELERALKSVQSGVDKIFITITGQKDKVKDTEKVCRKFNAEVSYGEFLWEAKKEDVEETKKILGFDPDLKEGDKLFMFDEARNFNFSQVPKEYEWILWMDTDDIFVKPENLSNLAKVGIEQNIEAFYFDYLYQTDIEKIDRCVYCHQPVDETYNIKHVIIKHLRERLVRNIGVYKWIAPIHETLIEQRPTRKTDNYDCHIVHLADNLDRLNSLNRNLKNLELAILKSEGKDPRHIYYLAKAYFDINDEIHNERAIKLIEKYLLGPNPSGWPEERAQAWIYAAEIYKRQGKLDQAITSCMNALIEVPDIPATYLTLATAYMHKQQWEVALFWAKMASNVPAKKTTLVINPKDDQGRMLEILYNCSLNLGKIDEAWAAAVKLKELYGSDPNMEQTFNFINTLKMERDLTNNYLSISNFLKNIGERPKIRALLDSFPNVFKTNPFYVDMYMKNHPPKAWGENEVAIYCGPGFTNWSPKQLIIPGNSFVGGSEEAVIQMTKSLNKLGWKVTVYADPADDEGAHDGVLWLPYYKFNREDNFNILIGWRDIRFFDTEFKAKKTYLWCHDIQAPIEYTEERVKKVTKFFFLSNWQYEHQSDLVNRIPKEKVLITSNGI